MDSALVQLAPLLARLVNYERERPDRRLWDLATMRGLLARPGIPALVRPAVQVGGSKGKGTTCAFLEALVQAAGRRAGVYSSPHQVTLLERVRCNGALVSTDDLEPLLRAIVATEGERPPTFFEAMTVAAAEWFVAQRVDLAVYEVGLGGRFDATTALPVDASVITAIELEHTDVLGSTIAEIAAEKAAIVRKGGVAFTAAQGEALAVIRAQAERVGARLHTFGDDDFGIADLAFDDDGARGRLRLPGGSERDVWLPDARAFEVPALALAAAAVAATLPDVELALDPAPRPQLPGRFEIVPEPDGEVLVLDGAHTQDSLAAVARELQRRWPGLRFSVLFAAAVGKRWQQGLSELLPYADSVVVTGLVGTSSEDPATVAKWIAARGVTSEATSDATSGLAALRRRPGPRVVVGSFFLVGQIRTLLAGASR